MTKRLYYADSYLKEFSAMVLDQKRVDQGPAVILDQTAFYPESGGQPGDTGTLQDARVLNVLEDDSGAIWHILDKEMASGHVSGQINWTRRFDHMQQHTGQHILSQAFLHVAQARTAPAQMEGTQALATNIVFQNRPIHILTTDRENLSSLGIRKESQREGEIRVIDVEGFDRSACGGTHVRNTGEIGLIFVLGFERYKGGTRVEFVAGGRALRVLHKDHEILKNLARFYSAAPESLPALAEKMSQERVSLLRESELLRDKLLDVEAVELLQKATKTERGLMVCGSFTDRKLEVMKALAQKLTSHAGVIAILGAADACQIVVARSTDLSGNCGEAIKKVAAELGGRGGGRSELAQAGGFPADAYDPWMKSLANYFGSQF